MLSFYDNRPVNLGLDVGPVLEAVIGQFLPNMPMGLSAILRYCSLDTFEIPENMMTRFELDYRSWAIAKLIPSLILDIYKDA